MSQTSSSEVESGTVEFWEGVQDKIALAKVITNSGDAISISFTQQSLNAELSVWSEIIQSFLIKNCHCF